MGRKIFGNAGFMRVSGSRKLFLGNGIWNDGMPAFDGFGFWACFWERRKDAEMIKKNYKGRCQFFMVTSLILLISVVSMMLLAATSDNVNILNYENKLIDKYSSWEQELEEREQAVKEQEQALEEK